MWREAEGPAGSGWRAEKELARCAVKWELEPEWWVPLLLPAVQFLHYTSAGLETFGG